jgi:hypothetical membrane protein
VFASRFFNTAAFPCVSILLMTRVEQLVTVTLAGTAACVTSMAAMHLLQPHLSPVDVALSYYMNGRFGWMLRVGLVALGVGSLTLVIALRQCCVRTTGGAGISLLVVWSVGAIIGGVFPPDPYGQWSEPPSLSGMIHGVAALVAFLAFAPAAWLVGHNLRRVRPMPAAARVLAPLAILYTASLAAFIGCLAPVFQNRAPYALGLVERGLIAVLVAWIVSAAVSVKRVH